MTKKNYKFDCIKKALNSGIPYYTKKIITLSVLEKLEIVEFHIMSKNHKFVGIGKGEYSSKILKYLDYIIKKNHNF